MSDAPVPDLLELMRTLPAGAEVHFVNSQITIAHQVSGVAMSNYGRTEEPTGFEWLLQYLPAGLPAGIVPGSSEWLVGETTLAEPIPVQDARGTLDLVLAAYRSLVTWCQAHERDNRVVLALDSLSRMAYCLKDIDPESLLELFDRVEPSLKSVGDFNLMMRFGLMVEEVCKASERSDRHLIERQTQATTCAKAWVLQRIGRLKDADNQLVEDEELTRLAGEVRGLAFTLKCRGRLRRLMAERSDYAPGPDDADRLLEESLADLRSARAEFQKIDVTEVRLQQVADTDALIARSHLVQGNLQAARHALQQSQLLHGSALKKTILDCLILQDELSYAEAQAEGTATRPTCAGITQVLAETGGTEFVANEIRGRAHFARAKILASEGVDFRADVDASLAIFQALGDDNAGAQVRWFSTLATERGRFADSLVRLLEGHPPVVRVRALDLFEEEHGVPELSTSMNKPRDATDPWWIDCLERAEIEVYRQRRQRW